MDDDPLADVASATVAVQWKLRRLGSLFEDWEQEHPVDVRGGRRDLAGARGDYEDSGCEERSGGCEHKGEVFVLRIRKLNCDFRIV